MRKPWLVGFVVWLMSRGIFLESLRDVTRSHVCDYGKHLNEKFLKGEYLSTTKIKSSIAVINAVMSLQSNSLWSPVDPKAECGVSDESLVKASSVKYNKENLPPKEELAGYLLELQKTLGITIREALELDLDQSLIDIRTKGYLEVPHEQVGCIRKVPGSDMAIKAIAKGIISRRLQRFMPKAWRFDDYLHAHNKIARKHGYSTNTARSEYVRTRYRQLTGVDPMCKSNISMEEHVNEISVVSGLSLSESKGLDKKARRTISVEIGVLGIDLVSDYLDNKVIKNEH